MGNEGAFQHLLHKLSTAGHYIHAYMSSG